MLSEILVNVGKNNTYNNNKFILLEDTFPVSHGHRTRHTEQKENL